MSKILYEKMSDCLDAFIRQIAKTSALVNETGLLTGKVGIAILLYHYARYKNDPQTLATANSLIDVIIQEISQEEIRSFDRGLSGIAWGFNYLVEQGFLESDDDAFGDIDHALFKEEDKLSINKYGVEVDMEKGLYILSKLKKKNNQEVYRGYMLKYLQDMHFTLTLRYLSNNIIPIPCNDILRIVHICDYLKDDDFFKSAVDALYVELKEVLDMTLFLERNRSDKYMLLHLLKYVSCFKNHLLEETRLESTTLKEVNRLYLNQLLLGRDIPVPRIIPSTLISIIEDKKRTDELLKLLNPGNVGLENYATGLAWSMLQCCIDHNTPDKT